MNGSRSKQTHGQTGLTLSLGMDEQSHLCYTSSQEGADNELEALEFCLNDDESEGGSSVHSCCAVFNGFDLSVRDGAVLVNDVLSILLFEILHVVYVGLTCCRILVMVLSIRSVGYGSNSGATRSETQARVRFCKSISCCNTLVRRLPLP